MTVSLPSSYFTPPKGKGELNQEFTANLITFIVEASTLTSSDAPLLSLIDTRVFLLRVYRIRFPHFTTQLVSLPRSWFHYHAAGFITISAVRSANTIDCTRGKHGPQNRSISSKSFTQSHKRLGRIIRSSKAQGRWWCVWKTFIIFDHVNTTAIYRKFIVCTFFS